MRKKYGLDIDGVLAAFSEGFTKILRELGLNLPPDYVPSDWNWTNGGLTDELMKKAWKIVDQRSWFWESLEPHEDMKYMAEFFNKNADKTCEIYFITSRNNSPNGEPVRVQTERWLYKHLDYPKQTINVIPVTHAMNKINVIEALGLDASIDDYLPTIINARSIRDKHHAYLLARPWNVDRKGYSVETVNSIKEFFDKEEGVPARQSEIKLT